MKYMMMLRTDENFTEAGPPPKELFERMDKFMEESTKAGSLVWAGGLTHTSKGAKVSLSMRVLSVDDLGFEAKSKEAAIEHAKRFMELHRDTWKGWEGVSEIREMHGEPPRP